MALIECVPNFSEGRRPSVIDAIVQAVRSSDVMVLDIHSDVDHNRLVLTIAGEPEPVAEAVFRAVSVAVRLIDMETHRGVHPRIGAVDVVPFVPLRDISMDACVTVARAFGNRVASALAIPVYFYENAALRADRRNLAVVRRGQFEGLKTLIETDPQRLPDAGPSAVGRAGAMAVGARTPLIAYNVLLDTSDVMIARAIAAAVRESNGGLKGIKALGLQTSNGAQVSINITDFQATPIAVLLERLHTEASARGVALVQGELVGLIPQAALRGTSVEAMLLTPQAADQVLEQRLGQFSNDYREIDFA